MFSGGEFKNVETYSFPRNISAVYKRIFKTPIN